MAAQSSGPDTGVLVVGAGPVGLSLAIELGRRGVPCMVVERNDRVGYSPRAKTTNARTREHLRRWGLAEALREASPIGPDWPFDAVFATRMNGYALARFENVSAGRPETSELYSEGGQWVPQYTLEEVLRAHAVTLPGVSVLFDTELRMLEQDGGGVVAHLASTVSGETRTVRSTYLVGADGARSAVRDIIGAKWTGDPGRGFSNYSIIFRAPELARSHLHGKAAMYWMVNPECSSLMGPMDMHGLWFIMATKLPGNVNPETVDPAAMIRASTGLGDLEIEIIRADPWIARCLIADRYSQGRVFLAGDACHLHPPFGGFGMNMGIGDGVDLGWKLAAVLQGWGGPHMLPSYETERRPVHQRTIDEANANYAVAGNDLVRPGLEAPGPAGDAVRREVADLIRAEKIREFSTLGLVLGACYRDSPLLVPDGTQPPPEHFMHYVPSASPGCLAPHAWLLDGSSLYDHFGAGYTLLVTEGGGSDAAPMLEAASELGMPLTLLAPGDKRLPRRYEARYALIRPDQHVAWRGDALPERPAALLRQVTGF